MKRLIDSLLSRWYVPRQRYDTLCEDFWDTYRRFRDNNIARHLDGTPPHDPVLCATLGGGCGQPSFTAVNPRQIVITTDFQRGCPCS